jgi:S-formylglutathione hydrolase FrmB
VLYLLHGLSDDHTAWSRYTSIGRYAEAAGLAVVMPAVHRSFYANESAGHRYWDFVSEELPEVVRTFFQVSDRSEDTFVAGLSMGGYGAVRLALTFPGRYAAAASMSGALDIVRAMADPSRTELSRRIFGDATAPELWQRGPSARLHHRLRRDRHRGGSRRHPRRPGWNARVGLLGRRDPERPRLAAARPGLTGLPPTHRRHARSR